MFHGTYTAIITPFLDGKVDEKKLEALISLQVDAGVQGIVPCGTTGESACLNHQEQRQVIETCVRTCAGRIKVLPGTGAPSTLDAITLTQQAEKAGADGVVVITPWYVKPSQEGLFHHYQKIREATDLPIILYNNPTRTGVEVSCETLMQLAESDTIQGYKESGTCLPRISYLRTALGDKLSLLAGNDDYLGAFLGMGADGGIFVASNAVPQIFVGLMESWDKKNLVLFQERWREAFPLLRAFSLETNPSPIRYAMHLLQGVSLETRLPFVALKGATQKAIETALKDIGLWTPLASVRER